MPVAKDHVIEGNLKNGSNVDFSKEKLSVHAFVKGQEVAHSDVDSVGRFKVTFTSDEERPDMELRVTPAATAEGAPMIAITEKLEPAKFSVLENIATAQKDFQISRDILEGIRLFRLRYHMHGQVFAQSTFTIEPVPALKMDFYEFSWRVFPRPPLFLKSISAPFGPIDLLPKPILPPLLPEEHFLGTAYTDPDGKYDFNFYFGNNFVPPWLQADPQPDIIVRISQFFNGAWNEVFTGPVDWNITPDFHRDFLIPAKNLRPSMVVRPATGFAFTSIGLIPCDNKHLVKGYAFTDKNDPQPIANMTHRPFGDTLRVGGLFAATTPPVANYKVEIAATDENHVPGVSAGLIWQEVLDPLHNLKWNATNHTWEHKLLGPEPLTHRFINIDTEPERNWFEHSLKFTFNSASKPDGFYVFRITGFDSTGKQVGSPVELPVLRFDNTVPMADLQAVKALRCGELKLDATRKVELKATAYDNAGHVLTFGITANRGKNPIPGDHVLTSITPNIFMLTPGPGIYDQTEIVTVGTLPPALAGCTTLAYNFELYVWGSATNGYSTTLASQYVRKDINLIVTEP